MPVTPPSQRLTPPPWLKDQDVDPSINLETTYREWLKRQQQAQPAPKYQPTTGLGSLVDKQLGQYTGSASSAPKTSYTPKSSPKEPDRYGLPKSVQNAGKDFLPSALNYMNRPVPLAQKRWDSTPFIIPNSGFGRVVGSLNPDRDVLYGNQMMDDLSRQVSMRQDYRQRGLTEDVGSWANAFIDAHADEGRLPTQNDLNDRAYSMTHPGSGPNGAWTERDWVENWYFQNNAPLPPDWR